jgi:signal transduction histidine kinase/DNA-binding response OmpR family regulator
MAFAHLGQLSSQNGGIILLPSLASARFRPNPRLWRNNNARQTKCLFIKPVAKIESKSQQRIPLAWIGAVMGVGVGLSLALFLVIRGWEERDVEKEASDLTGAQVEQLHVDMLRSMEVLHSMTAFITVRGQPTRDEFKRFVGPALKRQPELQALEWVPRVPAAERNRCEQAAEAEGLKEFHFTEINGAGQVVAAGQRDEYFPVLYMEPMQGNIPALGLDLGAQPQRREALELAARTGEPTATAPIKLAQKSGKQAGFLVFVPLYEPAASGYPPNAPRQVSGFAVAVFSVTDLVRQQFAQLQKAGVEVKLFDDSTAGQMIYANTDAPQTNRVVVLDFASRRWVVAYSITPHFQPATSWMQSWLVLVTGLAFTILTTAYLFRGWCQTRKIALANRALQEEVAVRLRAEAAAEAANEAKSNFLASMSHEIRTPLNAILGYTQLMQRDLELSAEQRDAVSGIRVSGQHLLGLINEILDLSKIEAGRMELNAVIFDLEVLGRGLAATFQPLCAGKRIGFRAAFDGGGKRMVCGDEGKLRQILINLLGNAVKFTKSGEVCLRCKRVRRDDWLFEVVDTGLGIPEEEWGDIFKPFHQGRNSQHMGGTGLGLAIAQRQVELIGGRLELQSERGIGSRFYFQVSLPGVDCCESPVNAAVIRRLKPGGRVLALVVDDHRENADILTQMLAGVGCEVLAAANGGEALRLAREKSPKIVFLDVLLPDANGLSVARTLLAEMAGRVKIVMHTASAMAQFREEAQQIGCAEFIVKPIRAEQVYECLQVHLGAEFEYAAPVTEAAPPTGWEVGPLELPEELYARLSTAAELHSTTALKSCLLELRQLGPEPAKLAEQIRQLMRSYDMDGILHLILRASAPIHSATEVSHSHASDATKSVST